MAKSEVGSRKSEHSLFVRFILWLARRHDRGQVLGVVDDHRHRVEVIRLSAEVNSLGRLGDAQRELLEAKDRLLEAKDRRIQQIKGHNAALLQAVCLWRKKARAASDWLAAKLDGEQGRGLGLTKMVCPACGADPLQLEVLGPLGAVERDEALEAQEGFRPQQQKAAACLCHRCGHVLLLTTLQYRLRSAGDQELPAIGRLFPLADRQRRIRCRTEPVEGFEIATEDLARETRP